MIAQTPSAPIDTDPSFTGKNVTPSDRELVAALHRARTDIQTQIGRRVIGQHTVVEHLLITLFARGHGLFVGVPGLAKTLLINTLADVLDLDFNRIQFTPDLMPSDITGTDILEDDATGKRSFRFVRGPVFCNLLLADEINRTPPKTQAALLQSMQEHRVTAGGRTYPLTPPFHVFATQNPIEQEGTYPLPEAQLDRFMMMLKVEYPTAKEESEIVQRTTSAELPGVNKVLDPEQILAFQDLVLRVPVADPVIDLAVRIVRLTRPGGEGVNGSVNEFVSYGAGPRATQHLVLAAKARAILDGRPVVDGSDIRALAKPVLRHRILTNFHAEARKVTSDDLVDEIVTAILQ
ncbi:MAG: AAA family ATPase [Deltaproteobacteria bacterium RIFOXYA12_FULL_58_15]|nr:MAG: AAA family ATPase [Deltaproteobacteria bacterium RIFOXYA12_FULL_58_15]OGR08031.1 MAG: AAA family ATPase [Deltaproteobacteria bacterium RIFOXYB12_FULL_58_9]